jgi:hypothetical protein
MVASWAGTSSWSGWNSWGDTAPATSTPSTSCNQQQSSTITNLGQTTNLVDTNAPIGSGSENVVIGEESGVDNPEPGTWALMAGGLAALVYYRKRRAAVKRAE